MDWTIRQTDPKVFNVQFDGKGKRTFTSKLMLLSDLHIDSPKCDRDRLQSDLKEAKRDNIPVFLIGDTFDCMGGKWDKRKSQKGIRPEHKTDYYFDAVVDTTVEFFEPYKDVLALITKGNHETAISKHNETDLIQRLVGALRREGSNVMAGPYSGFITASQLQNPKKRTTKVIYFHHGFGGGGEVSRGLQNHSQSARQAQFDVSISGHIHRRNMDENIIACVNNTGGVVYKQQLLLRSSTYKNDLDGWCEEKGMGPRPLGGWILELIYENGSDDKQATRMRAYMT